MHLAVIGTGRVGRPTAYTLLCEGLFDEITLVDVKPGLADAFAEELRHVAASLGLDVEIHSFDKDEDVSGTDVVIVCAGYPRPPGVKMDRRDLAKKNGEVIKHIAEVVSSRNHGAKYIIVTNPVDAMATLFQKVSNEGFVISTGTHLDTLRFRSKLARELRVPVSKISGFVGGEHGKAAVFLWSTVEVCDKKLEDFLDDKSIKLDKKEVENYVKEISRSIINSIGATEVGPASAFRDIVKAIVCDEKRILSIATPLKFRGVPESVHVSIPVIVGKEIGCSIYEKLSKEEREAIISSAEKIYETYSSSISKI